MHCEAPINFLSSIKQLLFTYKSQQQNLRYPSFLRQMMYITGQDQCSLRKKMVTNVLRKIIYMELSKLSQKGLIQLISYWIVVSVL